MDAFYSFFEQVPPEILGFFVSTIVFFITVFLVARKSASIGMAFLFLVFSLVSGLIVSYRGQLIQCVGKLSGEKESSEKVTGEPANMLDLTVPHVYPDVDISDSSSSLSIPDAAPLEIPS